MEKYSFIAAQPYLNRLALAEADIARVNPYIIIADFFYLGKPAELHELLMKSCQAALSEQYCWEKGSPGNLLFFYERMEKLVEASFLVVCQGKKNKLWRKLQQPVTIKNPEQLLLPCSLSVSEMQHPVSVIDAFFAFQPIRKWKQHMYAWLEAGLSNYSVLENLDAQTIFYYHHYLQKLLDACWYISLRIKKKKREAY